MSRLDDISYADLSKEQQETFDKIVATRPLKPDDGHIGGPFDPWVRSPEMGRRLVGLGSFFRFNSSVERRYIEIAILVTGQFWQAQFEWWAHEPMAREAGVPETLISAIKNSSTPQSDDPADLAAYQLAYEIHHDRKLSDATYTLAKSSFGETGVAELIGLCGYYGIVSMTLNGFEVELPAGATEPFPA